MPSRRLLTGTRRVQYCIQRGQTSEGVTCRVVVCIFCPMEIDGFCFLLESSLEKLWLLVMRSALFERLDPQTAIARVLMAEFLRIKATSRLFFQTFDRRSDCRYGFTCSTNATGWSAAPLLIPSGTVKGLFRKEMWSRPLALRSTWYPVSVPIAERKCFFFPCDKVHQTTSGKN